MKYLLIYIFAFTIIFPGCRKEPRDLFDKSADERLSEALTSFQNSLVQDPGWKLFVYPKGLQNQSIEVGGLTYYLKFNASNRVTMVSDFRPEMAETPKESGYSLKAIQFPSLVFDTYSYMHVAADPDPDVSSSPAPEAGYGWGTDFDFAFTEAAPKDTIVLKGNYNNSEALLIKATQEEMDDAFGGELAHIMNATSDYRDENPLLFFPGADNSKISVSMNLYLYIINFSWLSGDDLITISAPFSHTTYGLHLKNPVTAGGYTFQDLYWDDAQGVYYINAGTTRVNIANSNVPIIPFSKVIGKSITTITLPTTPLPGQSTLFITNYNTAKTNIKTGPYNLDLGSIDFIFDDATKSMSMDMAIAQDGNNFLARYVYSYTLNNNGIAKFTRVGSNGNAALITDDMAPILDYLDNDRFKLDYYTGASPVLGQFLSQDHAAFFFTGDLQ